jgi:hypothetical protein
LVGRQYKVSVKLSKSLQKRGLSCSKTPRSYHYFENPTDIPICTLLGMYICDPPLQKVPFVNHKPKTPQVKKELCARTTVCICKSKKKKINRNKENLDRKEESEANGETLKIEREGGEDGHEEEKKMKKVRGKGEEKGTRDEREIYNLNKSG